MSYAQRYIDVKQGAIGPPLSREVLRIEKLTWTASFSFPSHPFPSFHLPTQHLPLPPIIPSSHDFITKFKLDGINLPFLFYNISFTLFSFSSASCWIFLLFLPWLPFHFYLLSPNKHVFLEYIKIEFLFRTDARCSQTYAKKKFPIFEFFQFHKIFILNFWDRDFSIWHRHFRKKL